VKLLVELVLARILLPEQYGVIAMVAVFITVFNVFVDSGLGNALIQKKDADDLDFSSVFWFNVVWCVVLYGVLFLISPLVASFYHREELTQILRVLGLQIVISGVKNVYQAYVSRTMQFRKFFFSTLGGTVGAAVIGITMAYRGYGVWALVAQQLFNMLTDTVILTITVKWHPKRIFSFERLKGLLSYGWKLLLSALLDTLYNEARSLIIGRKYTSEDLAFYNRGELFPQVIAANVNTSIDSVLLPTMSREQDERDKVRAMTRRAIMTSTYIMAPLMIGIACIGTPLVRLILTEKWLPCVPYLQIFCASMLFFPIHTANLNAIKALGRSDLFLKLEILKKVIGIALILITMHISVLAMALSTLVNSLICQLINTWPNRKLLNYSYGDQIRDILPNILLAAVMGGCVFAVGLIGLPNWATLLVQVVLGAALYAGLSMATKNESYRYLLDVLKNFRNKEQ
jgi:O-antigen/teichoic acid export membrane protein